MKAQQDGQLSVKKTMHCTQVPADTTDSADQGLLEVRELHVHEDLPLARVEQLPELLQDRGDLRPEPRRCGETSDEVCL